MDWRGLAKDFAVIGGLGVAGTVLVGVYGPRVFRPEVPPARLDHPTVVQMAGRIRELEGEVRTLEADRVRLLEEATAAKAAADCLRRDAVRLEADPAPGELIPVQAVPVTPEGR